jgi:hypothetical protein
MLEEQMMRLQGLALCLVILGGALMWCNTKTNATKKGDEFIAIQSMEQSVENSNCLALANQVGNIEVKQSVGHTLKITAEKVLKNGTAALAKELFAKIEIAVRNDQNIVYIEATGLEYQAEIVAKYQAEIDVNQVNLEINYVLEVPLSLNQFKISTGVGNITLNDLNGSLDLKAGIGNIGLNNKIGINGDSSLLTEVGNVAVKLQKIAPTARLNVEVQTGNINLSLPQSIQCIMEIDQYMETGKEREINGGGAEIKAKAVLGKVEVGFYD